MSEYPHTLNLNLTIAGEPDNWTEVMVALKDSAAGWEVGGIGSTFLEAIANLINAIDSMTTVPTEVKAQLLAGGIQLTVMPWGAGSPVQGKEDPLSGAEPDAWWLRH